MHKLTRLALTTSLTLLPLTLLAATATASNGIAIEARVGTIITTTGSNTFISEAFNEICNLTLHGTLAKTSVLKRNANRLPEGLIAQITEGTAGPGAICTDSFGGRTDSMSILNNARRPIDVVYSAFLGTLPRINGIKTINLRSAFSINLPGLGTECLFEGNIEALFFEARGTGQSLDRVTFGNDRIPLLRGTALCPRSGQLRSTLTVSPPLPIRLI
jgi:hypothetical protein